MSLNEKYVIIAILIGLVAAIMALLHKNENNPIEDYKPTLHDPESDGQK